MPNTRLANPSPCRDSNMEVLVKKNVPEGNNDFLAPRKISKSEQRKLRQINRQKELKAQRAQVDQYLCNFSSLI